MGAIFCPGCRSSIAATARSCASCNLVRPPTGWPVDPQIGRVVQQKYRIDRRLSSGGFGTVFLAMQVHGGIEMGRVILKLLHPEHAANPDVTKRFLTEMRTARELINPHIVRVFDLGYDDDGTPFMVQEFIEGEGLDEILAREKRLSPGAALKIMIQVAEGMAEAHRKRIIHRDLKPENLRIQRGTGIVKILDFGIARVATARGTATNSFIGTPRYMPPEQIKEQKLDNGADIFALGVVLFEALAGEPPIPREQSELAYIHLNLTRAPRRLTDLLADCPQELSDFVGSMMAKNRCDRPPDMEAVAAALTEISNKYGWSDETTGRFRPRAAVSGGGAVTVALTTRDRTPSAASADEEVLELVPAVAKRRTGLWLGLGGIAAAAVVAIVVVLSRGGGGGGGTAEGAAAPSGGAGKAGAIEEAATEKPADARAVPADAPTAVVVDAKGEPAAREGSAAAEVDAGTEATSDAAVAVKIEDAIDSQPARPDVAIAEPADAGAVPPAVGDGALPTDAAAVGPDRGVRPPLRDAGRPPRDTGAVRPPRDAGVTRPPERDAGGAGFQFTKVGGGARDAR